VLVHGASGSVGTAAAQIAKNLQAHVASVTSTSHVQRLNELGADVVIDYTKGEYWRSAEKYDLIFDAVGKTSYRVAREVLRTDGVYMSVISSGHAGSKPADLDLIRDMVESGSYDSVIDECYNLEDMVTAQEYVETGHKLGNVVVRM
jgi:NADPH:quinone reductase-like Zn-dependent oxidoreductase